MFRIDTPYMNECLRRTIVERSHSIHVNDPRDVLEYLATHYRHEIGSHHFVTNSGDLFEIKIARDNRYVTIIKCD